MTAACPGKPESFLSSPLLSPPPRLLNILVTAACPGKPESFLSSPLSPPPRLLNILVTAACPGKPESFLSSPLSPPPRLLNILVTAACPGKPDSLLSFSSLSPPPMPAGKWDCTFLNASCTGAVNFPIIPDIPSPADSSLSLFIPKASVIPPVSPFIRRCRSTTLFAAAIWLGSFPRAASSTLSAPSVLLNWLAAAEAMLEALVKFIVGSGWFF